MKNRFRIVFTILAIFTITILTMGLLSLFKKTPDFKHTSNDPYSDKATNLIYNLLFCDNLGLYKENTAQPWLYPFDILFSDKFVMSDLQKIIDDRNSDPRIKVLAYNKQMANGYKSSEKVLLGVIVEIGLNNGLDVLASYSNGSARYINQTGKMIIWETTNDKLANDLTMDLFTKSQNVIIQIGPWDKPRRRFPKNGVTRITFLVSDGFYFGEAQTDILFNDPLASQALLAAENLMKYLTEKTLQK